MNRRKEESTGRKGRWQLGRPSNKQIEESSGQTGQTAQMTSSVCSEEASGSKACSKVSAALDFDMPKWENPTALNISPNNTSGKQRSLSPSKRPCSSLHVPRPGRGGGGGVVSSQPNFENMIITIDSSETSIDDELTYCDFSVTSASNYNSYSNHYGRPSQTRAGGPGEYQTDDEGAAAAQMAQEEEMIRLAIEQSLAEEQRKEHALVANGRQTSQPLSGGPKTPSKSQEDHRRIASGLESNVVHTDAKTGAKFMWKRGKGGRFQKVPVNADGTFLGHGEMKLTNEKLPEERLDELEQRILEEAMERSLAEGRSTRRQLEQIKSQGISEEEMLKIAMERSIQDAQSVAAVASHTSTASPGTVLRSNSDMNKDFVWKKGPNNRYYKVPIGLEQVNEFDEYQNENETREARLARMEQDMLEEAMERSMVETSRW